VNIGEKKKRLVSMAEETSGKARKRLASRAKEQNSDDDGEQRSMSEEVSRKSSIVDYNTDGALLMDDEFVASDRWVKVLAPKSRFHLHYAKIKSKTSEAKNEKNGDRYNGIILVDELDPDTGVTVTRLEHRHLAASAQLIFASDEEVRQIEDRLGEIIFFLSPHFVPDAWL
jgi:hypothetical protein